MKWILVFLAIWNLAGALLRTFRILLERFPLTRRLYPGRDLRALDGISDQDLSAAAKARYLASARELSQKASIPAPELFCSLNNAMLAGTRGWRRHELHLSRGILNHASDEELRAILAHEIGTHPLRHFAALRLAEILAALAYARVVIALWDTGLPWYGIWGCGACSISLSL